MAAWLLDAGHQVSIVARGKTYEALKAQGVSVHSAEGSLSGRPHVVCATNTLGPQDLIVVAVKAHSLRTAAVELGPLIGPTTMIVPFVNGIPWWFQQDTHANIGQPSRGLAIDELVKTIPLDFVIGAVIHGSFSTEKLGQAKRHGICQIIMGEPSSRKTRRLVQIVEVFAGVGLECWATEDVRKEVWFKLLGNVSTGPLCVLTNSSTGALLADPLIADMMRGMVAATIAVGEKLGIIIPDGLVLWEQKLRSLGDIIPSMLQDARAGRAMEVDAIVGRLHAMGCRYNVPVPLTGAVLGLVRARFPTLS